MKFDIKHRFTDQILYSGEGETLAAVVTQAVKEKVYLARADLARANLAGADLAGADLAGADLARADLAGADLARADLARADLARADLAGANLAGANLAGADLAGANLAGADLAGADLAGADLARAKDFNPAPYRICPEGSIVGWKKLACGNVLCLEIPADAKRVNAIGSRKCRAEFATVIGVFDKDRNEVKTNKPLVSKHDDKFFYRVGEEVRPDKFDDSITDECGHGIHFFITFEEARDY